MTQTQKNILICQARGWKHRSGPVWEGWYFHDDESPSELPDHFGSLDVMNSAEDILDNEQYETYYGTLVDDARIKYPERILAKRAFLSATAAQRAEAFGLTLGLWKEGE